MKIHFVKTFQAAGQVFRPGNDYDVENGDALRFINEGVARKSPEPSGPPPAALPPAGTLLKPGEQVIATAAPVAPAGLPDAKPSADQPPAAPANNPAGFLHAGGTVEPSTGFTTSAPDAKTSPPSGDRSPMAGPGTPEAVKGVADASNPLAPAAPAKAEAKPAAPAAPAVKGK